MFNTKQQTSGVILVHCLTECNKLKLPYEEYAAKLDAMLKERGVNINTHQLVEILSGE
jgi:hypothetical protein